MNPTEAAVVLLSGGIDSSVLLHLVRRDTACVHALWFQYGQRHGRELECARYQAEAVRVASFQVLDFGVLGRILAPSSALIQGGAPVPRLEDTPPAMRDQPPTYVPNRNMTLLAIAAAVAESLGISRVCYGAQAQDEYGYWDCTRSFLERMNQALALNRRQPVCIEAPLLEHTKADNVRLGLALGVDFARTWSCYRGESLACGECPTCVERLKAFALNNARDPLPYVALPGERKPTDRTDRTGPTIGGNRWSEDLERTSD